MDRLGPVLNHRAEVRSLLSFSRNTARSVSVVPLKVGAAFLLRLPEIFTLLPVGFCDMRDCDLVVRRLD
jgi:hypothetical protein